MTITYKDNPELFEKTLRENLSGENHTKESLIKFGVNIAIELEKTNIELNEYKEKAVKLQQEFNLANQFQNMTSWTNDQTREVLENDFGMTFASNVIHKAENSMLKTQRKEKAKFAANKKHEGTNLAKKEILRLWATGKYSSRDICAEQECADLKLSFATARKALRGTPKPQ